ncbi:efflux RND transporter periplasmic adaptor subunit, partial [Candidatus Gracilibacteria bacterium]|nr:efflux RND transporter periplasmic adaptor subunit [Candidatus Gracilibacteria bacterium]
MKKTITLFFVLNLILSSCTTQNDQDNKNKIESKYIQTEIVSKKDFIEELKFIGKVSPIMETSISPQTSGIIKSINVDVGQNVKAGDVLASIDLNSSSVQVNYKSADIAYNNSLSAYSYTQESIKKDLESAKVQLENAKIAKTNTYNTTEKQLKLAQSQLDNIRKTKKNTIITSEEVIKSAQIGVDLAKKSFENAKTNIDNFNSNSEETIKSINTKKTGLYGTIKVSLENAFVVLDGAIIQIDQLLGVTDKYKNYNDSYELYLGTKDSDSKLNAENTFREVKIFYDNVYSSKNYDEKNIEDTLSKMVNLTGSFASLYEKIMYMLDSSIVSSTFTQTQLDTIKGTPISGGIAYKQNAIIQLKSNLVSLQNSLNDINVSLSSTQTSINTTKTSLENALNIAQTQFDNAKQNLENLKSNNSSTLDNVSGNEAIIETQLENTIATVQSTRDNVDNALKIAQSSYDSVKAKLNASSIQSKTQLEASKTGKDIAGIQLNNTSIVAPFNGVIMSKNIEIGTLVSPGAVTFTIGNDKDLKVKMEINSTSVSNLKLGKEVKIQNNDKTFSGTIILLSPAADSVTKLFKAEASFSAKPSGVNIGDFIDIYVKTKKKNEKVIEVPFSALINLG